VNLTTLMRALAALSGVAGSLAAQQKASLSKPTAETGESFTQIGAVRELPNGRVLVADNQDKVVQLVDFAAGTMSKVGREGNGPGEYALPQMLLALPDGSTLVQDPLNRRFLTITPDGKTGSFVDFPRPPSTGPGGPGSGIFIVGLQARGTDARGRLYFQGSALSPTGGTLDSVAILRWDPKQTGFDTVGFVRMPPGSASATSSGGNVRIRIGIQKLFTPAETWGVAADGRIARVVPEPYQVIWLSGPSAMTPGPIVAYTPMKVTEADKQAVIEARKKSRPMTITVGGPPGAGGGGVRSGGGNLQLPPPEFAETKPPFVSGGFGGGSSVLVAPEGEVWVLRTRPAEDKIPSYDVFDGAGKLVKKVTLNPNSSVIGFGKGTVYVVRTDEDDLQYLQRYARP
jgi:hypothetical protein